jgi:hypothetical protein
MTTARSVDVAPAVALADAASMALLASGASLAIATLVGTRVTTWMTGCIARMLVELLGE